MSGGSFQYLHGEWPHQKLSSYKRRLEDMVGRLRSKAENADDRQTRQLFNEGADQLEAYLHRVEMMMRSMKTRHENLKGLMKAVEWEASCDWGEGRVLDAVNELTDADDVFVCTADEPYDPETVEASQVVHPDTKTVEGDEGTSVGPEPVYKECRNCGERWQSGVLL